MVNATLATIDFRVRTCVMESSSISYTYSRRSVKCFVSWLLSCYQEYFADGLVKPLRLSNFWLATAIIGGSLLVSIMFTTVCCIFFWWQRKKFIAQKKAKNMMVKHRQSAGKNANTPVIRSQDMISFVLPIGSQGSNNNNTSKRQLIVSQESDKTPNVAGSIGLLSVPSATGLRGSNSSLDPSDLNLKLYSPGHETNENVNINRAKIGVSLQYDQSRQQLTLKILGALNLTSNNKNILPNPYVKVIVLPGRHIKCSTTTLRSNCNPLFNQIFELDMSGLILSETELLLMVRDRPAEFFRYVQHYERCVSRSVTLGQATIRLGELEEVSQRRQVRWCLLEDASANSPNTFDIMNWAKSCKGEMLISLRYDPEYSRMVMELMQIRPLPLIHETKEKVTIKVLLYERGYLTASRRTNGICRDEATAALREKFVFALQPKVLHEASCQLVLVTKSTIGTKKTLGRITLGHRHFFSTWASSSSLATGIDHWHDMAHRPGVRVERWHPFI